MGNITGEQGLALQQHFPYKFPHTFKTSDCHKISSFNDGGLRFGQYDILYMLFPFLAFVKFMKSRSRDGLAAKGLFNFTCIIPYFFFLFLITFSSLMVSLHHNFVFLFHFSTTQYLFPCSSLNSFS